MTTKSAGAPSVITCPSRLNARAAFPEAIAQATYGASPVMEQISARVFMIPSEVTP